MFLSDQDKEKIRTAIRDAESQTSGEIVTVIARCADDYFFIPSLWAGLLALITPGILLLTPLSTDNVLMYTIQVIVFIVAVFLFRWTPLKMILVPKIVKYRRASRMAHEQFIQQGVHRTDQRNGLLIFVAVDERYVEIMADKGINDKVDDNTWDKIITSFVDKVRQKQIGNGFLFAIEECGNLLQTYFPANVDDVNELPNHLIELY